jgi:hypothetical protein
LPGAPDPNAPPQPDTGTPAVAESADSARLRLAERNEYERRVDQKHQALAKDPQAYVVAKSLGLQGLAGKIDPANPTTLQAFLDASQQTQRRIGTSAPRVLTNDQVASTVQRLNQADPAKIDIALSWTG